MPTTLLPELECDPDARYAPTESTAAAMLLDDPLASALFNSKTPEQMRISARRLALEGSDTVKAATKLVYTTAPAEVRHFAALIVCVEPAASDRLAMLSLFPDDVCRASGALRVRATPQQLDAVRDTLGESFDVVMKVGKQMGLVPARAAAPGRLAVRVSPCLFGMNTCELVTAGILLAVGVALAVPAYWKVKQWRARRAAEVADVDCEGPVGEAV